MGGRGVLSFLGFFSNRAFSTGVPATRSVLPEAAAQVASFGLQLAGVLYLTRNMVDRNENELKQHDTGVAPTPETPPARRHS